MDTPFLGGTYISRSKNLAYNRAVNVMLELVETKEGKTPGMLLSCPGYRAVQSVGSGPIRETYFGSNGLLYVVSADQLYELNASFTPTFRGLINTSSGPCQMIDNGTQLLLVDGFSAWCLDFTTHSFTEVLPGTLGVQPSALAFQDGFAVVNNVGTEQFYQSNLNNFLAWDALNFSSADSTPGKIVSMFDLHREVWIFKTDRVEIWVNAGLPGFAFQRLQGVQIPTGCAAVNSIAHVGDNIIWLSSDENGNGVICRSNGYAAVPISTHAIDHAIAGFGTILDAQAFSYQQEGHFFYVITFPSGNQTFVFDATTNYWHERASFANGLFSRYVASCHAFAYNQHVIGDFQNGNLYKLDLDENTYNGAVKKCLRSWNAFPPGKTPFAPTRFESLEVDCQTGLNVPDDLDAQFMLRWSDDSGNNWSNEMWTDGNQTGETSSRVIFQRLGSTKRGSGYDRIFELSTTDPVPVCWLGANLEASPL